MRHGRRLAGAGAMAAAVLAANPASGSAAQAVVAGRQAAHIRHVVVLFQENHSFDNVLGAVCQSRATRCDGFTGTVTLKDGTRVPLRQSPDIVPQAVHVVADQRAAIDGGAMDGWAEVSGCAPADEFACLTYYPPSQIPNLAGLAATYAVSDRTFSMADSPSWGGHLYAAAATLDGFNGDNPRLAAGTPAGPGWGCDSNKLVPWRAGPTQRSSLQPSCIPDHSLDAASHPFGGAFRATPVHHVDTIFDRLDAAGLSWKIYGQTAPLSSRADPYIWSICPSLAGCLYTPQVHNLVPTANVLADATRGNLPAYSVLTPSGSSKQANGGADTSQHNYKSMLAGDNWIGRVVSAIEQGPDANSTAIFITYDDCGCFYDHVPPGTNPDGTRQGPRMPMVIVSPYAKAGYTDSTPATFASILAFAEHTFGLRPLSANDAGAYDYSQAFDYAQKPLAPVRLSQHPLPVSSVTYLRAHPHEDDDAT